MTNKSLLFSAYVAGFIFALGLGFAGMFNPEKVRSFLDITGAWDPSLALVMGAALCVGAPGFYLIQRRQKPLFEDKFDLLARNSKIDLPLLSGAALFGIGWGLLGLCPAPALFSLATLKAPVLIFFIAMLAGMLAVRLWQRSQAA